MELEGTSALHSPAIPKKVAAPIIGSSDLSFNSVNNTTAIPIPRGDSSV